jgi:hypothetical protein
MSFLRRSSLTSVSCVAEQHLDISSIAPRNADSPSGPSSASWKSASRSIICGSAVDGDAAKRCLMAEKEAVTQAHLEVAASTTLRPA